MDNDILQSENVSWNLDWQCDGLVQVRHKSSALAMELIFLAQTHQMGALHWRHNGHNIFSNRQPHDCLLNRLFRRRSKKISKLRITGLCVGHSPETGEFPAQMASNAENVSIWWRHHVSICSGDSLTNKLLLNHWWFSFTWYATIPKWLNIFCHIRFYYNLGAIWIIRPCPQSCSSFYSNENELVYFTGNLASELCFQVCWRSFCPSCTLVLQVFQQCSKYFSSVAILPVV